MVPGLALRQLWRPSVAGRQRLKCVRTDPAFSRDGRDRRPSRVTRLSASGSDRRSCERSAQHRVNRAPLARPPATDPAPRTSSTGEPASPKADAAPLSNASGSAPRGRDGVKLDRCVVLVKDFFLARRIFLTGRIRLRPPGSRSRPGRRIPTEARAIRPWCPRTGSPALALSLVVVARVPLELTEELQHALLPPARDKLLQRLLTAAFFVRSPRSSSASSINSGSMERFVAMCGPPHTELHTWRVMQGRGDAGLGTRVCRHLTPNTRPLI